jgi:hypothetical protein
MLGSLVLCLHNRSLELSDSWNVTISGNRPAAMAKMFEDVPGHLTAQQAYREDLGWRNRSASLVDLDEMIGVIIDGLVGLDVLDDTIVFFTSDNGYHLGEHKMPFGKGGKVVHVTYKQPSLPCATSITLASFNCVFKFLNEQTLPSLSL